MDPELQKKQQEFFDTLAKHFRSEGFEVQDHQGWPLVTTPTTVEAKKKLLDMKLPIYAEMMIYREGALFLPGDPRGS